MGVAFSSCWEDSTEILPLSEKERCITPYNDCTNLLSLGVLGTGRSSVINTVLDSGNVAPVSGGQLRGTSGFELVLNASGPSGLKLNFIDAEGVRRDQLLQPQELQVYLHNVKNAVQAFPGRVIGPVLFTLDVEDRTNGSNIQNVLSLLDKIPCRINCFLVLTKWNTNSVQAEWNEELLKWSRRYKRTKSRELINTCPPSTDKMYDAFQNYVLTEFDSKTQQRASTRIMELLERFDKEHILWAFNLDKFEQEDKAEGELSPHVGFMYDYYREILVARILSARDIPIKKLGF